MFAAQTTSSYAMTIFGLVVGIITFFTMQFTFFPQFVKGIKTKNTSGISLAGYIAYTIANIFYVLWSYGLYFNNIQNQIDRSIPLVLYQASIMPIVITNSIDLILMLINLSIKIHHLYLAKKLNVSEIKLAEILLQKQKFYSFGKKYWSVIVVSLVDVIVVSSVAICLALFTHATYEGGTDQWIWVTACNLISAACSEIMNWSQFIKSMRSKDTSGLSLFWTACIPLSGTLFFTYVLYIGFAKGGQFYWPVICCLVLNGFIPSFGLLGHKIHNVHKAKKAGLTEIEYIKLRQQKKK